MTIDPNDESTLPPLGECVVLILSDGDRCLGGRCDAGDDGWEYVGCLDAPVWDGKQDVCDTWCLGDGVDTLHAEPVSWHPIEGEA